MSNRFQRFLAFILTAILLLTAFPAAVGAQGPNGGKADAPRVFTQADEQLLENDVFARIEAVTAPSSDGKQKGAEASAEDGRGLYRPCAAGDQSDRRLRYLCGGHAAE